MIFETFKNILLSASFTQILFGICCVLLTYYLLRSTKPAKDWPPGPRSNYLKMIFDLIRMFVSPEIPHLQFKKLGDKYGPIVSVPFGPYTAIYIHGYHALKKAFIDMGDEFAGRGASDFQGFIVEEDEKKNLIASDGPFWREHRRFTLSTLRDFGIGKTSLEPAILEEIHHFLMKFEEKENVPFNPADMIGMSLTNVIFQLEIGKRFEYDDPEFMKLKNALEENSKLQETAGLDQVLPILKYVPYMDKLTKKDKFRENYYFLQNFFKKVVESHYATYKKGSKTDFIDAYITEKNERAEQNRFPEMFDDAALRQNLNLLYMAGKETLSYTLLWSLLYMIVHPDIQRKVQKEIDDVIGRERTPSYEDKKRMPYTDAVMMEVQRISCVVGLNIPHGTTQDVTLHGYEIPKGTIIFNSFWSVHHDEKLFPDPGSFRPERFINEEGKAVKPEYLIPFSLGKRFCLGEPLARMELFLYFTSMLRKFNFKIPEGDSVSTVRNKWIIGGLDSFRIQASVRY